MISNILQIFNLQPQISKVFSQSLEQFFHTVGENNFGNKIPFLNFKNLIFQVLRERFPRFVKVTRGRFSQLMSTKKLLVMAVLEENKLGEITPDMEAFRAMLHSVMENHIDRYRPHYQFGWTGSPDLANSVAMDALSVSTILGKS